VEGFEGIYAHVRLSNISTQYYYVKMKYIDGFYYFFVILLLATGLIAFLRFVLAEAYIDNEGFLHEPFPLIPIGYLLIIIAVTAIIMRLWRNRRQR